MVAVIADDFTGAAELAGIGLNYGLKVQLTSPGVSYEGADLFILFTDSRSLNKEGAEKITAEAVGQAATLQPELLYKKIDSVLRGHVYDELKAQMQVTGITKAFVLPANPSLGRTIKKGIYYIHEKPVSEAGFAADPEFAIADSSVLKMIRAEVRIVKLSDPLPEDGIMIGEAESTKDVLAWADKISGDYIVAGASDFFTALLAKRYKPVLHSPAATQAPYLYISGTAFDQSRRFIRQVQEKLGCVAYLPPAMLQSGNANDESWLKQVNAIINEQGRCVIAIGENKEELSAAGLRNTMAGAVKAVLDRIGIKELFIEGGSTAAVILDKLGIKSLEPVDEWQRGVVRMKAKNWLITVKPGSYELPSQIKQLY